MSAPQKPRAGDVVTALRERFAPPEWAFMEQVANGTGANGGRWADAIAMNLYPSRGLELHGFEVKVSRSDWLSEMRNPAKAEAVAQFCDRWWIAVGSSAVVQPGELPPTWGLLVLENGKIRQHTPAPKLDAMPLSRTFIAAILRRAQEHITDEPRVRRLVAEAQAYGRKTAEREMELQRNRHRSEMEQVDHTLAAFGAAAGHPLMSFNAVQLGQMVRAAEALGAERLLRVRDQLATALQAISDALPPAPVQDEAEVPC